jgi:N-methylhydantoinase A/oxoprolinase/acetone carboxylase beta subunit
MLSASPTLVLREHCLPAAGIVPAYCTGQQAGAVTSFDEGGGCTVQVACIDGRPRNLLEAADAALWRLKQRAAQLLQRP